MTHAGFLSSTPFIRLVSLIICYSLVSPFLAFGPDTSVIIANGAPSPETIRRENPLQPTQTAQKAKWRDGELLVRFRASSPAAEVDALLSTHGVRRQQQLRGQSGIERLRLTSASDPIAVSSALRASRLVDFAEPNYLITADQFSPNDPRFPDQWALKNTDAGGDQLNSGINASKGWELTTGSRQTVVAVLDSGVDFTHPDLRHNEWNNSLEHDNNLDDDDNGFIDDRKGWDFVADSNEIKDTQGHGTAVAGIIAAQGNNAIGITGVMWRAGLMSLRVLDDTSTGDVAAAVEAIDYAASNGAQVINCSWGTDGASIALLDAINRAGGRGVIVVASAGNDGRDLEKTPRYPASFDLNNLITVASTDNSDMLATWSNRGGTHVTLAAPGTDILTTKVGRDYQTLSGSSASAPLASGVAGLIKTLRPWLNAERTREIIIRGARKAPSLSDIIASGGVLDIAGVIEALNALPPTEGLENSTGNNGNNGGEHGNNGQGRGNQGGDPPGHGNGNGNGREVTVAPLPVTPGAPGLGLPNLDQLRRKQPTEPKAPNPIPSNRCAHHSPQCDKGKEKEKNKASIDSPINWLAFNPDFSALDSWLSNTKDDISDSPFSIFRGFQTKQKKAEGMPDALALGVPYGELLLLAVAPAPPPPGSYNAVNDFSATQNNGTWKYGYKSLSGSTFNAYPSNANLFGGGLDSWSPGYCCPMITRNNTGTTYTYPGAPSVVQPTDVLNLHPGPSGERSIVRWTAPSSGTYIITGRFQGIDTAGTTTDVAVLHNSTSIFTGNVNGYGNQAQFSVTRTVVAGDTIDFQTGYGSNNSYASDSTGLAATISKGLSVESVAWTNVVGVTASGNNLSRPSGTAWDAGAVSTRQIASGDGYVEFTATENNTYRMCGLSNGDSNQVYTDIDFAIYPAADGNVYIYEGGVYKGWFGAYSPGNRFRVSVESGVVKYWKNGALFYTSAVAPTYPLLVDTSLYSPGSTVTNATIAGNLQSPSQNVFWTNVSGVTATGNSLSRASYDAWDGGAVSIQTITSGDGYVELTANETNTYRMCGLSNGDSSPSYTDIDFALYLVAGGVIQVYEGGAYRGQFGTYAAGDKFRVSVEGGVVKYSRNGSVFYTSAVAPTYPLLVDTSLYSNGATIGNVVLASGGAANSYSAERVDPINRTGTGGVDLLSRNANWSLPILELKGRAGLDLGLSLSYNSLVWTKSQDGASIKFDADQGMPSPGFRLGFPVIQPRYYNSQIGANAYLLITPLGGHTELRQVDATTYESGDASYLQLKDNGGTLTLKPTDGAQLTYTYLNGQYQCTQIKDRNGNFITVEYWDDGRIKTVTDTLARVITFNYDAYINLSSITQSWGGTTHQWATFGWSNQTISTSFSNQIVGPQNGTAIPVLTQVGYADGTRYNFEYNGYAQVNTVRHYAADNHQLSYTSYTLPASTSDCPRVTETKVWAENWNNNLEATSSYTTASDYSSGQVEMPDHTFYKELYATSGWQKGLPTATKNYATNAELQADTPRKRTTSTYTQSNVSLPYMKNPRVVESNIYDAEGNRRRTVIEYNEYPEWGLPSRIIEYEADGATELRHTFIGYLMTQPYLDNRLIGLVRAVHVSDTHTWHTIIYYDYDAGGTQLVAPPANTIQHDAAYGTGISVRGNLTTITRYDVYDINNASKRAVTQVGYTRTAPPSSRETRSTTRRTSSTPTPSRTATMRVTPTPIPRSPPTPTTTLRPCSTSMS